MKDKRVCASFQIVRIVKHKFSQKIEYKSRQNSIISDPNQTMATLQRFIETGQDYERDDFVADEDELIEYEDESQDQDEDSFDSEEATDSDVDDEDEYVEVDTRETRSSSSGFYKKFLVEDDQEDQDFLDHGESDVSDQEEHSFFQRMTRARARVLANEKAKQKEQPPRKGKKRQAEPDEQESDHKEDIYLFEPESEEDMLVSMVFSLDRHRLSFPQLYEFHLQYMLKRILYPRVDKAMSNKTSEEFKRAQMLYADRLQTQIDACLNNLAFSQAWRPRTLTNVQQLPFMTKKKLEKLRRNEPCDACRRVHTVVSYVLFFWGTKCKDGKVLKNAKKQMEKGYHNLFGEDDSDDIVVADQRTMFVGDTCAARLKLYHKLYHRDTRMAIDLIEDLESFKRDLSSFRTLRKGKRILVEPSPDKLEKEMLKEQVPRVANKWSGQIHRAVFKCSDFTEGGKHVWSKRKYNNDVNLFKLSEYDSDDSGVPEFYPVSDFAEISDDDQSGDFY